MSWLVNEIKMTRGVQTIFVDPWVKGCHVHIANLLVGFCFEVECGGIGAAAEESISRVERCAELFHKRLNVGIHFIHGGLLTFPHFNHVITELTQLLGSFGCGLSHVMHGFSFMIRMFLHAVGKMGGTSMVKTPVKFAHGSRAGVVAIHQKAFERPMIQETFALISGVRNARCGGRVGSS